MNPVAAALLVQAILSLLLALLLRALHQRVRERPLYRWWAVGWLLGALWQAAVAGILGLGLADGAAFLALGSLAHVAAFLSLACLVVGAQNVAPRPGEWQLRRLLVPVAVVALLLLPLTMPLDALGPRVGASVRSLVRQLAASATFFFCAWRFRRAMLERAARELRVGAVGLLAWCLTGWGVAQLGYAAISLDNLLTLRGPGLGVRAHAEALGGTLVLLDFCWIFGIAVGTILGLLDEYARLERQMVQARQYEAIGRLAGGIAHDFNNLLTAVLGSAGLLRDELPAGHAGQREVDEISAAAVRGAELTRRLLQFSASAPGPRECTDVAAALREALPGLNALLGDSGVEVRGEGAHVLAAASRADVDFLLANLVRSAGERLAPGGRLAIRVRTVVAPAPIEGMLRTVDAGTYVVLECEASAGNFLPAVGVNTGAGVGLAITCGLVELWGGQVQVEALPGAVTRTIVSLPAFFPGAAVPAGRS